MLYLHQLDDKIWIQPMDLQKTVGFWLEFYFQNRQ
mgnify:CR=1 FL=1